MSDEALTFVDDLARRFGPRRRELLAARAARQTRLDAGERPGFLAETSDVRAADWRVPPAPADLNDRRVEITGPAEPKMMINALNSGASCFMVDLEDSLSPSWENVQLGHVSIAAAIRRELRFENPDGKQYRLNDEIATLLVRPRGWHLEERHHLVDGEPVSASLFDAGLFLFHNARELLARGSGPYLYLPKLESHLEARLWHDVFCHAEDALGLARGTVRATVLIETILGAFEMEEILFELGEHAAALNAGRWDYIFSVIKKFRDDPAFVLPDRASVTMTVPFMRAYTELLVSTCHRRGAHAIGGMAAFIPSRRDPEVNERALASVRADKQREADDGCDGTWVAHPDLVGPVREIFDAMLGDRPNQKERLRDDVVPDAAALLAVSDTPGEVTEAGVRLNVSVGIQYLDNWLRGNGAAAINNLMEDAATAEISRGQLWQWIRHGVALADGRIVTAELYEAIRAEELAKLGGPGVGRQGEAATLLDRLVLASQFEEFLTIQAYEQVD